MCRTRHLCVTKLPHAFQWAIFRVQCLLIYIVSAISDSTTTILHWGNFLLKTNNQLDSMTNYWWSRSMWPNVHPILMNALLSGTPGGKLITTGTKDQRMTYLPRIIWPVCPGPGLHWGRCSDSSAHNHASRWCLHSETNITWVHAGQCQRHQHACAEASQATDISLLDRPELTPLS